MKHLPRTIVAALCAAFLFSFVGCAAMQKQLDAADPADKGQPVRQGLVVAQKATTNPTVEAVASGIPYGKPILTTIAGILGIALFLYKGKSDTSGAKLDVLQHATGTPTPTAAVAAAAAQVTLPASDPGPATPAVTPPKS